MQQESFIDRMKKVITLLMFLLHPTPSFRCDISLYDQSVMLLSTEPTSVSLVPVYIDSCLDGEYVG